MTQIPAKVHILEEGPREGFQYEKGPITTARKIELVDALSATGLRHIQVVSFVNPKRVPGMADADEVVAGITRRDGVRYTGLWLNAQGFKRALATGRLDMEGTLSFGASDLFLKRNQNRTIEEQIDSQREMMELYAANGVALRHGGIMAAFGCNYEGEVPASRIVSLVGRMLDMAAAGGQHLEYISLADTMAWATPATIKRTVGAIRERYPDLELALHLHDTRGQGIANAYAGLEMGIARFDAAVAGLGGCPFAGNAGAAGNVCTEDLVFMCEEMGIATGLDLDRLIECARLAEDIVGHPLPGTLKVAGTLSSLRLSAAKAKADAA